MQRRSAAPYAALAHPLAGVFPCRREDPTGKLAGSYLLAVIQMRTPARPLLVARRCLFAGRGTPAVGRSCGSGWRLPAAASRSCGHPADEADQSNRRRRCRSGVSLPAVSVRSGVYLPTSTQREKVELAASAVQIRRCRREALPAGSVRGPRSRLGEPFLSARARLGARSIPGSTGRRFGFGAPVRSPIETQQPGTRVRPIRSVGCTGRPGRVLARRPRDWLDQRRPLARSDGACASPARFPARGVGCTGPSVHPRRPRGGSNQSRPLARSDGAHASNCRVCAYKTALIPPLWPPLFPPPTCPPRELPAPPLACASGMASAEGSEVAELIAGNRKDAAKGNSSSGMACELLQWADTKPLDYVKHALELREAATTAGFLPFMCQGPEMPLVHTLEVNVFSKLKEKEKEATATKGYPAAVVQGPEMPLVRTLELKQAHYLAQGPEVHRTLELKTLKPAEYLASMRQGPETLTLIPCGLVRTIPRCLPQSIPKQVVAPVNLGIKNVDKYALEVRDKLKRKGPGYSLRSIRATIEILKENQESVSSQSSVEKFKAWADNTSRGYTLYSIGEKVLQLWDKYFPKQ